MLTSTNFYGSWRAKVANILTSNRTVVLNALTDLPDIWRVKEAESGPRETVLGSHCRQSEQSRLELGLCLSS
jgi:hypothetical protein